MIPERPLRPRDPELPLDRHARRILELMAAGSSATNAPPNLEELRRGAAALAGFAAPSPPVERADEVLKDTGAGIAMRRYTPIGLGHAPAPALIYFHGGGWVSGGLETHDAICATLAAEAGCRIVAVAYRLAPEHRFPAAWEDCCAAARMIVAEAGHFAIDPYRLGVAGDSVGASLAVSAARALREDGSSLDLQVLLCPVLDALGRTPSRQAMAEGLSRRRAHARRILELLPYSGT